MSSRTLFSLGARSRLPCTAALRGSKSPFAPCKALFAPPTGPALRHLASALRGLGISSSITQTAPLRAFRGVPPTRALAAGASPSRAEGAGEEEVEEEEGNGRLPKQLARALRAEAHKLKNKLVQVQVGKLGVTPTVIASINENLVAHELIKIKVSDGCPDDITEVSEKIADELNCALVSKVGRTLLLYRERGQGERRKSRSSRKRVAAGGTDTVRATNNAVKVARKETRRDKRISDTQDQKLKARRAPPSVKVVGFDPDYAEGRPEGTDDRDGI